MTQKKYKFLLYLFLASIFWAFINIYGVNTPFLKQAQYSYTDKYIDFVRYNEFNNNPQKILDRNKQLGFSVLTIDHKTYKKWGLPLATPRTELTDMLKALIYKGVKNIYLDFNLTRNEDGVVAKFSSHSDKELLDVILNNPETNFILNLPVIFEPNSLYPSLVTDSIYTSLQTKNVTWVSPYLPVSEDAKIREFSRASEICFNGKILLFPTAPNVLANIISKTTDFEINQLLSEVSNKYTCAKKTESEYTNLNNINFSISSNFSEKKGALINKVSWSHLNEELKSNTTHWIELPETVLIGSEVDVDDMHPTLLGEEVPGIFLIVHSALTLIDSQRYESTFIKLLPWLIFLFAAITHNALKNKSFRKFSSSVKSVIIFIIVILLIFIGFTLTPLLPALFCMWAVLSICDEISSWLIKEKKAREQWL